MDQVKVITDNKISVGLSWACSLICIITACQFDLEFEYTVHGENAKVDFLYSAIKTRHIHMSYTYV